MKHETINVEGMMCSMCSRSVERAACSAGCEKAQVNLMLKTLTVDYDEEKTSIKTIMKYVGKAGYKPFPPGKDSVLMFFRRIVFGIVLLIFLLAVYYPHMYTEAFKDHVILVTVFQFVITTLILIINRTFFIKGFMSVISRSPGMDVLISLG